jgi:hypothetical protein
MGDDAQHVGAGLKPLDDHDTHVVVVVMDKKLWYFSHCFFL